MCLMILDLSSCVALEYFVLHKAHSAMHCAILCKQLNPRVAWCFAAEAFMGVCRRLALSCSRSNSRHHKTVPHCNLLMMKYSAGMHLAMSDLRMFFWAMDSLRR